MTIKRVAYALVIGITVSVVIYGAAVVYIVWPVNELSIANAGTFGDSFGLLTALFSGLAFAGVIITILLQRDELRLQRQEMKENRKEFSKSANAQERSAQLSALSALLNECDSRLNKEIESLEMHKHVQHGNADLKYLLKDKDVLTKER